MTFDFSRILDRSSLQHLPVARMVNSGLGAGEAGELAGSGTSLVDGC